MNQALLYKFTAYAPGLWLFLYLLYLGFTNPQTPLENFIPVFTEYRNYIYLGFVTLFLFVSFKRIGTKKEASRPLTAYGVIGLILTTFSYPLAKLVLDIFRH